LIHRSGLASIHQQQLIDNSQSDYNEPDQAIHLASYTGVDGETSRSHCRPALRARFYLRKSPAFGYGVAPANEEAWPDLSATS
jgi:hypothetical protein